VADRGSSQVVQIETLGRTGLIVVLVMFVVISVIGMVAGYALGVGEARAESATAEVRRLNAKVEVLQYDLQDLRAKTGNSHENTEGE
jgi:outer membrane murein-binding lipoprotein Lpp